MQAPCCVGGAVATAKLTDARPDMPKGVDDRDADIWESLLAIADAAGGDWPTLAREAAVTLVTSAKDRELSLGIKLLTDLRTVFGDGEQMTTVAILAALQALPESPWGDLKGKPLNDRGLSLRLREYGVKSQTIRTGVTTAKGYLKTSLHDAWARYLSPPDGGVTSDTAVADEQNQWVMCDGTVTAVTDGVATVTDGVTATRHENASNINDVADVTGVTLVPEGDPEDIATTLPPDDAVCGICGEGGDLWPDPSGEGWIHEGCYAERRQAADHSRGARP